MPAPLTMEQKIERAEAKLAAKQQDQVRTSADRPQRTQRGAFNGTEGKLKVAHGIEGYHLHILNDTPGRIQTALDNGYEFVTPEEVGGVSTNVVSRNTDLGDKVRYLVGRDESGGAMYAYLMKIRLEWYEEDQAALQRRSDMVDEAIRAGKVTKDGHNTEGFYSPKGGIKLQP